MLLMEPQTSGAVSDESGLFIMWNAGSFGFGRLGFSLPNMRTTDDILGLSEAISCTHSNAIWMNLATSSVIGKDGSITSTYLSSAHVVQA